MQATYSPGLMFSYNPNIMQRVCNYSKCYISEMIVFINPTNLIYSCRFISVYDVDISIKATFTTMQLQLSSVLYPPYEYLLKAKWKDVILKLQYE